MLDEQTPRLDNDPEMDPTGGLRAFNQWLRVHLRARKLTQRQLAQKTGVDHSTISRIVRGDRVPSLRTATLLAYGLGMSQDQDRPDDETFAGSGSPTARVEYALRSDDQLREADVREIMDFYLAARLHGPRRIAIPAPGEARRGAPVPIIIAVAQLRSSSSSMGRLHRLPATGPVTKAAATASRSPVDQR